MYVPVLNYFVDVEEATVVLCLVIIAYLAVMHIEFRQLKLVSRGFSREESDLSKCIRELKDDLSNLNDVVRVRELKTISSHVTSNTGQPATQSTAGQAGSSHPRTTAESAKAHESYSSKEPLNDADPRSLKDLLDKV